MHKFVSLVKSHILGYDGVWYSSFWSEGSKNHPNFRILVLSFSPRSFEPRRTWGFKVRRGGVWRGHVYEISNISTNSISAPKCLTRCSIWLVEISPTWTIPGNSFFVLERLSWEFSRWTVTSTGAQVKIISVVFLYDSFSSFSDDDDRHRCSLYQTLDEMNAANVKKPT